VLRDGFQAHGWPSVGLHQLITGSEGTLAVVTEAELQLVPRPKERGLLVLHWSSLQAALDASVSRVIHTGSIAGMGIPEPGVIGTEEMIYNLSGLGLNYCDSKHAGEQEVLSFAKQGLPVVILNPGIIFGEGDTHPHHRTIFAAISRGWLVGCPKGGVTFCDIKDVIEAHLNAMTMGRIGERYVIGSCNLTYRQAACVVSEITGLPPPRFEIPGCLLESLGAVCEALFPLVGRRPPLTRQVAWLSQRNIFFSFDKARRELGLKQTTFQDTIRRTAAYYLGGAQSGNRRR